MIKIDTIEYKGYTIKIDQDESPESPREWDNLGTMICKHRDYNLGDNSRHNDLVMAINDLNSWAEVKEFLIKEGAIVILPLYLFDHSGLTMKTDNSTFRAIDQQGWDWGQVGFIYATKEDIKKVYEVKKVTKTLIAKATKHLQSEVKTYDQFLTGDIWGYDIEGIEMGSCWGFYGQEDAITEAKRVVDYDIADKVNQKALKTKKYVKQNVPLIYRHV